MSLLKTQKAATLVEVGLLISFIAAVSIGAILVTGNQVTNTFETSSQSIQTADIPGQETPSPTSDQPENEIGQYRYWRFVSDSTSTNAFSVAELELRETHQGPDISNAALVITPNSEYDANTVIENAFDQDANTSWGTSSAEAWVSFDFGEGNTRAIEQIALTSRWTFPSQQVMAGHMEASDDGITWETQWDFSYTLPWGNYVEKRLASSPGTEPTIVGDGAHRYWRIVTTTTQSNQDWSVAELMLRNSKYGEDLTDGATFTSSSSYDGNTTAEKAFDNNINSVFASIEPENAWVAVDFGAGNEQEIIEFGHINRHQFPGQQAVTGAIQYSDDGISWDTSFPFNFETWTGARELRTITKP